MARKLLVIVLSLLAAIPSGVIGGMVLYTVVRLFGGGEVAPGGAYEASALVAIGLVGVFVFVKVRQVLTKRLRSPESTKQQTRDSVQKAAVKKQNEG